VSYLLQYARRSAQAARVDERLKLNHPDFDGGASVRVYVEDTSKTRRAPHLALRISDCDDEIELEFGVHTPELRANSLYKIDTLLGALSRFRDGLAAEIALYESRH
jgi:hypothetical protein